MKSKTVTLAGSSCRKRRLGAVSPFVWPVVTFAGYLAALSLLSDPFLQRLAALLAFWAALGMSWNIIGGYVGQLSLGHAAFVGLGAFSALIAELNYGISPWIGLLIGAAVSGFAALVIGAVTLRLSGTYFALATMAYPLIFQIVFVYLGYQEPLIPAQPDQPLQYMQWVDARPYGIIFAVVCLLCWLGILALERSRLRYVLTAVREDEAAAAAIGVNAWRVKLWAFVISGAIAGLLGVVYSQMLHVVAPESVFGLGISIQAMMVNLVGGIGHPAGPLIGALVVVPISQALDAVFGSFSGASQLVYGVVLIVVVLVMPSGLIEAVRRRRPDPVDLRHEAWPLLAEQPAAVDPISPPETAGTTILSVAQISKAYRGVIALRDVSFEIKSGEFVGIVGPNGAGKTTLFDLLTGFQRPTRGTLVLRGEAVTGLPSYAIARRGVRRTFQIPRPFAGLTACENVMLGTVSSTGDEREKVLRALDLVGLTNYADWPARRLGPAQQRLLEVARALAGRPDLLLLDEPLAGLAPSEVSRVLSVLKAQHAAGLTIILVDHDIESVASVVDRLVVLSNGHLIADGPPQAVTRSPDVIEAYLGRRWGDAGH